MQRLKHSFINAFRGIRDLIRTQQNFCIELAAAAVVLIAAYVLHLRPLERVALVMMIIFVLAAEAANSVLESILDGVSKNFSPRFRMAKDMLAGITLIVAIGAAIIGAIIFYPYVRFLIWQN
jgi:diacylglycerol kinase (ATP)